jgi:hypothetical protein
METMEGQKEGREGGGTGRVLIPPRKGHHRLSSGLDLLQATQAACRVGHRDRQIGEPEV